MADKGFKRKLAAILSADAVGYSRLMGDDEEATIRTLTEYREVITAKVKQYFLGFQLFYFYPQLFIHFYTQIYNPLFYRICFQQAGQQIFSILFLI